MPRSRSLMRCALAVVACTVGAAHASGTVAAGSVTLDIPAVSRAATATLQAKRMGSVTTGLFFPMQITPRCDILDNFGDPRPGGRVHEGTDTLATLDQEVYATVDGTLGRQVIAGQVNSSLSGNSWRLVGTGGQTYYMYAHLSHFPPGLTNGSVVTKGQLIGYVGDTGDPGAGNYHLHFEVHPNGGVAVNALTVLTVPNGCTVT